MEEATKKSEKMPSPVIWNDGWMMLRWRDGVFCRVEDAGAG
jgi:hypothetical protein